MAGTVPEQAGEREPLSLSKAAQNILLECRLILPGLEALLGFQFMVAFQPSFAEKLSPTEQQLHLLALGVGAVAAAILMTPAAYHRQTEPREVTAGFLAVSTRLLMASMPLLALSIGTDFYLIARLILNSTAGAILATLVFAVFVLLWFVLPRVRVLQRALGDRCQPRPERPNSPGPRPNPGERRTREAGMATSLEQLPAWEPESGRLQVVIETPKGSRNKYKYEPEGGIWRLKKVLPLGAAFPFDFGFIPSTKAGDGDPLDALVLMDETAFPGCVVGVRLLGVIEAEQTEKGKTVRNDRLIAVLDTGHNPAPLRSLEELGHHRLDEIEHFFVAYNEAEGRTFKPLARRGPEQAQELIKAVLIEHRTAQRKRKTPRQVKKAR